jgi:hypothetical protein
MSYMDEFFPVLSNIDGRNEFERLIYGDVGVVRIGRPVILRRLSNRHCACWDGLTGGPVNYCSYCKGEGYEFTEETDMMFVTDGVTPMYKAGVFGGGQYPLDRWGQSDASKATAFCSWKLFQDYERYTFKTQKRYDKLLLLKVDGEGEQVFPQIITEQFKIINVVPRFGEMGKVEFIELNMEKEDL